MFSNRTPWTLLLSLVIIVGACSSAADTNSEGERTYLTETIPPCVATEVAPDPCPEFLPTQKQESSVAHLGMMPWFEVPSLPNVCFGIRKMMPLSASKLS